MEAGGVTARIGLVGQVTGGCGSRFKHLRVPKMPTVVSKLSPGVKDRSAIVVLFFGWHLTRPEERIYAKVAVVELLTFRDYDSTHQSSQVKSQSADVNAGK